MKRIFLVVQTKDTLSALKTLRAAGILHVDHVQAPKGGRVSELKDDVRILERAIALLSHEPKQPQQVGAGDCKAKAQEILGLAEIVDQLREGIAKRQLQIEQWEPWGDFSTEDIESLRQKGFTVELAEVPERELDKAPEGVILEPVFVRHKIARCIIVARGKVDLPYKTLPIPHVGLARMREAQQADRQRMAEAQRQIIADSKYLDCFQETLSRIREELTFQEVYAGKGEQGQLAYIKGFCPEDLCPFVKQVARKEQWGVLVEDPAPDDQVPTLLRNPRWVEVIKPVFGMINVLPGYRELDVSVVFLFFFSVFFGMLVGDAGYGVIFGLLTLLAQLKLGKKMPDQKIFYLLYVLSGCTVVWGILTGTYFGQEWLGGAVPPLLPWLTENTNIQALCFFIGALHLSIAHIWRAILKMPSLVFLADLGWLAMIWGMFFVAKLLILGAPFPSWAMSFFIVGPALIVFFTKPNRNPLKAIGPGIGGFLLNAVNSFSDVVSYIRLFAVGMASVALSDAFNDMALGFGFGSVWAGLISALILVIGHVFNIVLGSLAILVHGLRLNVLEFSSHLNLEWAGFRYDPFKKTEKV